MADRKITALTELTAPVAADVFPIIDVSESANANKNKKIQLTTILKGIPNGTVSAPSVGFIDDNGATGFFRVASNEIGISANQSLIGSFTNTGFQLGSGTPAAQLHLFSTDTTDQVIIENTSDNADNAPDLVLFRNSASPAADDNLGNLVYRGEDAAGNPHDYASVVASIETTTDGSEDGILDIMSSASGTLASRIRLKNNKVGIGESDPIYPMHLTTTLTGQALQLQCDADDAASGANLMLYHRRGASGAGQDNDVISTIFYRGKNDAGTPEEIDFVGLEGVITDASDGTEDGKLNLQVMTAGTLTTKLAIDATGINITGTVTDDGAVHDGNVDLNGNIDVSGTSTLNNDVTFTGASANIVFDKSDNALEFADNAKATFGSSADFAIFHNGTDSFIENSTGNLHIRSKTGEEAILLIPDSAVQIYHDNAIAIHTQSWGNQLYGTLQALGDIEPFLASADTTTAIRFKNNTGEALKIIHQSSNSFITNNVGSLFIEAKNGEKGIAIIPDGSVELYHDNVKRLETSSNGAACHGRLTMHGDIFSADNHQLMLGNDADLSLLHNGTDSKITNNTFSTSGNLLIEAKGGETAIKIIPDGAVEIYHDNVKKAETSATGINVTGTVVDDGATHDGDVTFTGASANVVFDKSDNALEFANDAKAVFGDNGELQIFRSGTESLILENQGNNLNLAANRVALLRADRHTVMLMAIANGAVELYHNNVKKAETTSSGLTVTGTVTETSDIAYKSDIKPITNTLDKLQQITGYKYKLDNASIDSMGVIAQDVEKVFPELVHGNEGSKTLQYSGLIGVLVEAVKDLSAKVKKLESN